MKRTSTQREEMNASDSDEELQEAIHESLSVKFAPETKPSQEEEKEPLEKKNNKREKTEKFFKSPEGKIMSERDIKVTLETGFNLASSAADLSLLLRIGLKKACCHMDPTSWTLYQQENSQLFPPADFYMLTSFDIATITNARLAQSTCYTLPAGSSSLEDPYYIRATELEILFRTLVLMRRDDGESTPPATKEE